MKHLKMIWKASAPGQLFNLSSDEAKGRTCMISSSVLGGIAAGITGGVFYSGFLLGYGIDIVKIGILTFVPYIASIFSLLSPVVLERFQHRRTVLAIGRVIYYTINILGLTLLPRMVESPDGRTLGFALIVFLSAAVNNIFAPGYTVWHLNFLPDKIRADYFNISSCISTLLVGCVTLITSALADSLAGSPNQLDIIVLLRYIAYGVALLDVLVLCLPKEYPYPHSEGVRLKFTDTFRLPFKHKKFLLTMVLVMAGYTFAANISTPVINVHLLENVGVSYTLINGINFIYFLFFIMLGKACKKSITNNSWFKTFAIWLLINAVTFIPYAFVDAGNKTWAFILVRLAQHVAGIFVGMTYANFPYINTPKEDRTTYLAFYTIVVNAAALLSMLFGTWFVSAMGESTLTLFGKPLGSVPLLMLMTFVLEAALSVTILILLPKLNPDDWEAPPKMPRSKLRLPAFLRPRYKGK